MPGTYSTTLLHLVFSTRHRDPLIAADIRDRLYAFMGGVIRDERGSLLVIGGMPDHVHLLVRWNTEHSIAHLARNVKARSTKWIHDTFSDHRAFAWQTGYGVFSVSKSQEATVRAYIDRQEEHHRT